VTDFLKHIEHSIRRHRLFRDGQQILLAVSGGLDSMALLQAMHKLSAKHGWQLTIAHLNHQLRGRSSDADERLVRQTAAKLRLRCVVQRLDIRKFAREHKVSVEMAARERRHDFLARTAVRKGTSTIALAQHADDQIELFFLRLLRGSGGEGLAGMRWRNPSSSNPRVELVRPLLDLPKSALRAYADEVGIQFREDATNARLDIQRNRLRHELLPLLRRKYQPALDKAVHRVSEIVGAEAEFVTQTAMDWLQRKRGSRGRSPVFGNLNVAVQRRCIQLQLLELGIKPDFSLVETLRLTPEQAVTVACRSQESAMLGGGNSDLSLHISRDRAGWLQRKLMPKSEFQTGAFNIDLRDKRRQVLLDRVRVLWKIDSKPGGQLPKPVAGREFFDAEKVGHRIVLRHWQPGDRFQPIGLTNPVKLQDFFTNEKVDRALRHKLLVGEAANGTLFWVEGHRISEQFKLTSTTRCRLNWRWKRL
jgi:tRNA(Ile)-lysidine synthase